MSSRIRSLLVTVRAALALWVALYSTRSAEREPSETLARFDGAGLRRSRRTVYSVARARRRLTDALEARGIGPRGEPVFRQSSDAWRPPFLRRNEVAVDVPDDTRTDEH
ncbi:hypothetical protein [Haloarcula litorea]|uniref:hypothetical protein n=1 Tax=Haloarcula litorea TaxID=3032579 RepID=UPI0023E78537|nr:hypothetical protein [Halomicroarcula sp. GDY20]